MKDRWRIILTTVWFLSALGAFMFIHDCRSASTVEEYQPNRANTDPIYYPSEDEIYNFQVELKDDGPSPWLMMEQCIDVECIYCGYEFNPCHEWHYVQLQDDHRQFQTCVAEILNAVLTCGVHGDIIYKVYEETDP